MAALHLSINTMGFGFNLIGLPLIVILTLGLIVLALFYRSWIPILVLVVMWVFLIAGFAMLFIILHYDTPIQLTRQDIIGEYRIDRNFYPGKNAQWQYDHYKYYITDKDSIVFVVYNDDKSPSRFIKHKISYVPGYKCRLKINADSTYHVINDQPTLYRSHSRFYYVFKSVHYGNMYFRKVEN